MLVLQAEFIIAASTPEQIKESDLPEIAFSGRSNVGKSSLLNSIVLRKKLAFVSSEPGKTQNINFFLVENKWLFADMPGFGYAKTSRDKRNSWIKLNYKYLESRKNLRLVCVLVDSRHDPMDIDLSLMELLENIKRNFIIILTKCDKISATAVTERKKQLEDVVKDCRYCAEVLPYSSVTGTGRNELIAIIKRFCSKK